MVINLIKTNRIFSMTLPAKVKGSFWLTDLDPEGNTRKLISAEAQNGYWVLKSTRQATVLDGENRPLSSAVIQPQSLLNLRIAGESGRVILFAENVDESRHCFRKVLLRAADTFTIGRTTDNHFCFENKYVSGKHARLSFDGKQWHIQDTGSTNGTYVNGFRVESAYLIPGDLIYIMGLQIIIGRSFLAVNNPDHLLRINSANLTQFRPQQPESMEDIQLPAKKFFFRSPRFRREVESSVIRIDPPPQPQKVDTVPLALMLGPSLTMAMTSVSTGMLTVSNVISNGGEITQALPTLIMSVSMLLGTVLWPMLTRKYEAKARQRSEQRRHDKYLAYLDSIRDEIRRQGKEQADILHENLISTESCVDRIVGSKPQLWERAIGHSDFLRLRLGTGDIPMQVAISCPEKKFTMDDDTLQDAMLSLGMEPKQLTGVPISLSLAENTTVGVCGKRDATVGMLRSLILQMVALHSYDELKLILICDEEDQEQWNFVRFLPHFWDNEKTTRFFAATTDEVKELSAYLEKNILVRGDQERRSYTEELPYYVMICASQLLGKKCDALQQLLKFQNNCGFSVVFQGEELKNLPKESSLVVLCAGENSRMFDREDTTGKGLSFKADTVQDETLCQKAAMAANIELSLQTQQYALPNMLTFLEMFDVGKIEHLNILTRWKENNPTKTLQTPVGVGTAGELFWLDLHEKFHGPHGLVAGMTGSGKSEFIITYILSLAVNYHPDEVAFILIDYKGGGLAGAFEDPDRGIKLPHLAGTITNLDGAAVKRSLISIQSELRRRQAVFQEARKISNEGTMDIYKYQQLYRDKVVSEPMPHLFIISDEFAELKTQQPEFMEQLISAARIGRSLGVHLILATQKPSGVVDDQIWSNSKFRVCLKVQEKADSQDMIKCSDAAELSQTGRFYLQVGFNELFELGQSAWCGAEYIPADTVEKNVDNGIQVVDNLGRVITSVKPEKKKAAGSKVKQIVAIVKHLSDLAAEEQLGVRPLWLDPIPGRIFLEHLEAKYGIFSQGFTLCPLVGEYDDPFNQKQGALTIPFTQNGNCLVYGATGNGKTTFLTALAASLIRHHNAKELNLYIMDFGSETLKAFEQAPQVGGVMVSADEEKTRNFMKLLQNEMEDRKNLFSAWGGDHSSYCRNSGSTLPNIVVLLNNFSGFAEQFDEQMDLFTQLTRDGVKYGIYFAVTAGSTNAVRYQIQQNFSIMMTMQLNDPTDYAVVVGKTGGLIPSKFKGRGLAALDEVYEFQTAYCTEQEDVQGYLRSLCEQLRSEAADFAKPVPVLPKIVDADCVRSALQGCGSVPVGVGKVSLAPAVVNLENKVIFPVAVQEAEDLTPFLTELVKLLPAAAKTVVVDAEKLINGPVDQVQTVAEDYESFVRELFAQMVERNNTYKDAHMAPGALDHFEEQVIVITGWNRLLQQLSTDGADKLKVLLLKAESCYKLHFILAGTVAQLSENTYEDWFKRQVTGSDGLWIGDNVTDQYLLKVNKMTPELYDPIGCGWGYLFTKGRMTLVKLMQEGGYIHG